MPKEKQPKLKVNAGDMVAGWRNNKMIFGYVLRTDILNPNGADNPYFEVEWFPDNDDLSGTFGASQVTRLRELFLDRDNPEYRNQNAKAKEV